MKEYTVTSVQIDDMKHCIGIDCGNITGTKHRKYSAYRNYFTTSGDDADWDKLVEQGLAVKRDFPHGCGDNPKAYSVSDEGKKFLGEIMQIEITEDD
jgi:hypothetical protein